jgi:hypothetical protein
MRFIFVMAMVFVAGCEHVNVEWDWQPLLESVAKQVFKGGTK